MSEHLSGDCKTEGDRRRSGHNCRWRRRIWVSEVAEDSWVVDVVGPWWYVNVRTAGTLGSITRKLLTGIF